MTLASTVAHAQDKKLYKCREFNIEYPFNWIIDTLKQQVPAIFFYSPIEDSGDMFSENVNVMMQNLAGKKINLNSYKEITENQIKQLGTNGGLIKSTISKTDKGDRYNIEYTMTLQNSDLHIISICYIKNEIAYLVTLTTKPETFDKYKALGVDILESFELR